MRTDFLIFAVAAGLAVSVASMEARAETVSYDTNFTKDNNIYTNLNEQFPNTGPGVPGSGVGVPNATYFWTPPPTGPNNLQNDVNNGISFTLTSNATGQDFAQIGPVGYSSVSVPIGLHGATNVYMLVGAYNGTSANVTFSGTGGATESFNNVSIPDFNGGSINSTSSNLNDQTVFQVHDQGAGGTGNSATGDINNYDLTELSFTLGSQFAGQTLNSATITSNGYETLLLGVTSVSPVPLPPGLAMFGSALVSLIGLGTWRSRRKAGRC